RRAAARRGHHVSARRAGDDVAGVDVDVVPSLTAPVGTAAPRARDRHGTRRPPTGILRPRTPAVLAHGGRRSDASVSTGVGLLTSSARRRYARRLSPAAWLARIRR